jgi:hypothetical protein
LLPRIGAVPTAIAAMMTRFDIATLLTDFASFAILCRYRLCFAD